MIDPNPYAPPGAAGRRVPPPPLTAARPPGDPLHEFTLPQGPGRWWILSIFADALYLADQTGAARMLDRAQFVQDTSLSLFAQGRASLSLQRPPPRATVALTADALPALRAWLGPALDAHLAKALQAGRGVAIGIGLGSLIPGGRAHYLGVAFGALWLAWAVAVTVKPHRALFLLHAALWAEAAVQCFLMARSGSSLWYATLLFFALAITGSLRSFAFYGRRPPLGAPTAHPRGTAPSA